jgi:probable H4MPT-linked C1 transfer pathway protein
MKELKQPDIVGWDIGGAHVKAVIVNDKGVVIQVLQYPCLLWQGLQELQTAANWILKQLSPHPVRHVMTMTGELVDLFDSRWQGVQQIIQTMEGCLKGRGAPLSIYAGEHGFLMAQEITVQNFASVASANWLASLSYVAGKIESGLFVDVGSTTTDVLIFKDTKIRVVGRTDFQRLCSDELVYTGIIRTPVMAIAGRAEFNGQQVNLMAEYFASMADVYRLTGELIEAHDQMPAADGGVKSISGSTRRQARMIGCDYNDSSQQQWQQFAVTLREKQLDKICLACERQLSRGLLAGQAVVIGAGTGRFLVRDVAKRLDFDYVDFADLFHSQKDSQELNVADCAPAASIAHLVDGFC